MCTHIHIIVEEIMKLTFMLKKIKWVESTCTCVKMDESVEITDGSCVMDKWKICMKEDIGGWKAAENDKSMWEVRRQG